MKIYFCCQAIVTAGVIFLWSVSAPAKAAFLSYQETVTTKTQFPKLDPKMAAMMAGQMPEQPPSTVRHYVHDGKMASVTAGESTMIIDYKSGKMTNLDHQRKTYWEASLKQLLGHSDQIFNQWLKGFQQSYQKLKGQRKVAGKTCSLYRVKMRTKITPAGKKGETPPMSMTSNHDSTDCILLSPPAAWRELMTMAYEQFKDSPQMPKDKAQRQVASGLRLYSKGKVEMAPSAAAANPAMQQFLPEVTMVSQVSNLSEKAFSAKRFATPSGYKKVEAPFAKRAGKKAAKKTNK